MTFYKLKHKSIITNKEIELNKKYGLPVEIFCPKKLETIAFGKIEDYSNKSIQINGRSFCRDRYTIFGIPYLSA